LAFAELAGGNEGKTDLAIQLADKFKTSIISVDSALIYKGMDIGTAKPNKTILEKYPHHLIDICNLVFVT
jgi:tRNA dimethylallyltransferase